MSQQPEQIPPGPGDQRLLLGIRQPSSGEPAQPAELLEVAKRSRAPLPPDLEERS